MNFKLLFTLALSVSAAQAGETDPKTASRPAGEFGEYLLYQTKDGSKGRTLWVKVTDKGTEVLGEFADPLVAWGGKLYAVGAIPSKYKSYDCEEAWKTSEDGRSMLKATTTRYTRIALRDVVTKGARALWIAPAAPFNVQSEDPTDAAGTFENGGGISGFVGPYVIVDSCNTFDVCGPHDLVDCESHTFDLSTGRERHVETDGTFTMPNEQEKKALWAHVEDSLPEWAPPFPDEETKFASWRPRYGANGLEISLLMSHYLNEAECDWDRGDITAVFPQKTLPKDFEPYKNLPKGLEKFASTEKEKLVGFSRIQKSEAVDRYLKAHVKPAK